jgi:hypothetical protein
MNSVSSHWRYCLPDHLYLGFQKFAELRAWFKSALYLSLDKTTVVFFVHPIGGPYKVPGLPAKQPHLVV